MKSVLKFLPVIAMTAAGFAQEDPVTMTDKQKEEFIESLKILQDSNANQKLRLIRAGIAALSPAAANENEAMNLFERCYKKQEFEDKERKDKEWREWKTQNKETMGSAVNKRALRYQIRWALITLQAAMEPEDTYDPTKYAPQAIALLTEILKDTKVLGESKGPYNGSVITGPIGQMYELNACRPQGWPDNIMDPHRVIESLVLAPSREKGDVAGLRRGWSNLIAMQKVKDEAAEKAAAAAAINQPGDRRGNRQMNRRGGFEATLENMYWMCELDCYKCGDELSASSNMLRIIKGTKDTRRQEMLITAMVTLLQEKEDERDPNEPRRGPYGGFMGLGWRRPAQQQAQATPPAAQAPAATPATPSSSGPATLQPGSGGNASATSTPTPPQSQPPRPAGPQVPRVEEVTT